MRWLYFDWTLAGRSIVDLTLCLIHQTRQGRTALRKLSSWYLAVTIEIVWEHLDGLVGKFIIEYPFGRRYWNWSHLNLATAVLIEPAEGMQDKQLLEKRYDFNEAWWWKSKRCWRFSQTAQAIEAIMRNLTWKRKSLSSNHQNLSEAQQIDGICAYDGEFCTTEDWYYICHYDT